MDKSDAPFRVTNLELFKLLGVIETKLEQSADELRALRGDITAHGDRVQDHIVADEARFAKLEVLLDTATETLERVKGPIDTFLSSKAMLLGLAMFIGAILALVNGASTVWTHASAWFLAAYHHS